MSSPHETYVSKLERELMVSSGRWIANFNESHRGFRLSDIEFDVCIRGNTRVRGFLLSRFFSFFLNPNYEVACFISSSDAEKLTRKRLHHYLVTLKAWMEQQNVKWSWLFLLVNDLGDVRSLVEEVDDPSLGIVAVNPDIRESVSSKNYIGRQARRYAKF